MTTERGPVTGVALALATALATLLPAAHAVGADPAEAPPRAEGWVLTGSLVAKEAQVFRVPRASNWQIQLTWMIEEGSQVEPGDPVARLDPGETQDELIDARDRLQQKQQDMVLHETQAELDRIGKQLALATAEAEADKARIDASVPQDVLEGKDYRERQLELKRKEDARQAARMDLAVSEASHRATAAGDQIEIAQLERSIARFEEELENLVMRADRTGIVVYGEHPWWGRKFQEGDQVQMGFVIATIPDLDTLEVHAWALEVDLPGIHPGQKASVVLDAWPEREFGAQVVAIGISGEKRSLWGETPWFPVTLRLDEVETSIMKPGMSVRCVLEPGPAGSPPAVDDEGAASDEPSVRRIEASGELESANSLIVGCPQVDYMWEFTITSIADEGKEVAEGEPLLGFDGRKLTERLEVKNSELDTARKELEKSRLDLEDQHGQRLLEVAEARAELARIRRELDVPTNLVAGLEMEKLQIDERRAGRRLELAEQAVSLSETISELRLATTERKVRELEHEVARIQEGLARMRVTARRAGYVVHVPDWQGEKPQVGQSVWRGRPLLELADLSRMQVAAEVAEADARYVEEGQRVEIRLDAAPDRLFHGSVRRLGRLFRNKSKDIPSTVFDAVIGIDEPDPELMRPGMAVSLDILAPAPERGIQVSEAGRGD